ncbi:DivIVA domain-containing protein [Psychromicrobium xiongbiense]|uniref:DivIVA domain-containing protein n=1 Tax=Psychromicrobium xiongbiense TaxID=3051184 RepID=UPI00255784D2|nr:DivIVA domain-containing protein [Psychromicrobium sp. YIM S02556]
MALTPEDVVNKRFQPTKFREGYDQDEVDDFLDEIVVELRRLYQENDELRKRLAEAGQAVPAAPATPVAAAEAAALVVEKPAAPAAKEEVAPVAAPVAAVAPAPVAAPAIHPTAESAAGVLTMAQKLHDEYVTAGLQQRDKIIGEAQVEASGLVNEAQEKSRKVLGNLEQQRAVLERKVEQLRSFERDYRSRLKAYIEGQLSDLEARGSVASGDGQDSGKTAES